MSEANKACVVRFNREVIEAGSQEAAAELLAPDFVNRSAPPGVPSGPEGMTHFLLRVLRPAFGDLRVEIHRQVAEGDLVTTHKTISGVHRGEIFGVAPTGKPVRIEVMDIVRVKGGKYVEHWGVNTLAAVVAELAR